MASTVSLLALVVMIGAVAICLALQLSLLIAGRLKEPHRIFELARAGDPQARICVAVYGLALIALLVLVLAELIR